MLNLSLMSVAYHLDNKPIIIIITLMKNYCLEIKDYYDEVFYFDANIPLSCKVITVIKLIPVQKIHHSYEDSYIDIDLIL